MALAYVSLSGAKQSGSELNKLIEGINSLEVMGGLKLVSESRYSELQSEGTVNLMGSISLIDVHQATEYQMGPAPVWNADMIRFIYASPITVFVRTLGGKETKLLVEGDWTVRRLKYEVGTKQSTTDVEFGVVRSDRIDQQTLIYRGQVLDNERTLSDYKIRDQHTLYLVLRPGGGPPGTYFLDPTQLDPTFDKDYTDVVDTGEHLERGGWLYERPFGYQRFALKVLDKPDFGGNTWLGKRGERTTSSPGEWLVSYHGTTKESARGITATGYRLDKSNNFVYGVGIYSTPSVECAARYAKGRGGEFTYSGDGKKYLLIMQNRVNPVGLKDYSEEVTHDAVYFVTLNEKDTRPYGICIRQQPE